MDKQSWSIALYAIAAGAMVAALTGAGQAAQAQPNMWTSPWFLTILSAAFVISVVATILMMQASKDGPKLVFDEPQVHLRAVNAILPSQRSPINLDQLGPAKVAMVGTYATTHIGPGETTAWFAYVPVENRSKAGRDAANVKARLLFTDTAGEPIAEMHGRWAETSMDRTCLRAPSTARASREEGEVRR